MPDGPWDTEMMTCKWAAWLSTRWLLYPGRTSRGEVFIFPVFTLSHVVVTHVPGSLTVAPIAQHPLCCWTWLSLVDLCPSSRSTRPLLATKG